jgi:hypothetical protein
MPWPILPYTVLIRDLKYARFNPLPSPFNPITLYKYICMYVLYIYIYIFLFVYINVYTYVFKYRFWNALTDTPLHRIDTGSQVCSLMWSKNVNEIGIILSLYTFICKLMYAYMYMHINKYIFIYIPVYIYIYICIY